MRYFIISASIAMLVGCATPSARISPYSTGLTTKSETVLQLNPIGRSIPSKEFTSGADYLKEISRLGGVQGEYETDQEFSTRMASLGNYTVVAKIFPSDIKFDKSSGAVSIKSTMMDAQGFGFESGLPYLEALKVEFPSYYTGEDVYSRGEYSGQNAFGASATINRQKIDRYYLVFSPVPKVLGRTAFFRVTGKPNITAKELELEKENLGFKFTLKPEPKFASMKQRFSTPTISNPYDSEINNYFFPAKIFWVRVVNVRTGKVYDDEAMLSMETM